MLTRHRPCTPRSGLTVAVAALLCLLFLGFAAPGARAATTTTLNIFNFGFGTGSGSTGVSVNPTIQIGDTVHWVWASSPTPHSTTSVAGLAENWDSGVTSVNGATFDHTFTHAGTFAYYCTIHGADNGNKTASGMSGFITVLAAPEPSAWAGLGLGALGLVALAGRVKFRRVA